MRAVIAVGAAEQVDALGRPCSTQCRRAILAAVSMASPPPEARNTFASSIGAWAASRAASALAGGLEKSPKVE